MAESSTPEDTPEIKNAPRKHVDFTFEWEPNLAYDAPKNVAHRTEDDFISDLIYPEVYYNALLKGTKRAASNYPGAYYGQTNAKIYSYQNQPNIRPDHRVDLQQIDHKEIKEETIRENLQVVVKTTKDIGVNTR